MKNLSLFFLIATLVYAGRDEYKTKFCTHTFAGDFYLKAGDTLREDVSVSGGSAKIDGVIDGDLAVMGGSVVINGIIDGDVAVFGGEMQNCGRITGDAAVAGGSIKNIGSIEGDVAVAGGTVELDSGSVIDGDIAIIGGNVDRSDYAVVKGRITALDIGRLNKVIPKIRPLLEWRRKSAPLRDIFAGFVSIAFFIVMYILNLLCLLIFPSAIERIGNKIKENIWIGVAIGIGVEILLIPLIILFAISIIGIPIIPAFVLAVFIGITFGLSAFSTIIGERICLGLNWQLKNKIGIFTIGWLGIMLVLIIGTLLIKAEFFGAFIFILGLVITYVSITIGLGSVIYALVKKERIAP